MWNERSCCALRRAGRPWLARPPGRWLALAALLIAVGADAAAAGAMREVGALSLGGRVTAMALRPDGRQAAALSDANGGTLSLVDVQPSPVLRTALRWATTSDSAVRYSPDGRWVVANGIDAKLYDALVLADASTGEVAAKVPVQGRKPPALAFSPDGRWLAVSARGQTLTVLDLRASPQGWWARLLAWIHPRPTVTSLQHQLVGAEVSALGFNASGDRLNVHRRGEILELRAPEFAPGKGRNLALMQRDTWATVCGDGVVVEFFGTENPVMVRFGPFFLASPGTGAQALGEAAIALPFERETVQALSVRGTPHAVWCNEAHDRLYALTHVDLVAWDVGERQAPRRSAPFPSLAEVIVPGAQFHDLAGNDWHAALNRVGEISVLSLRTGREIGWVPGDAAAGSNQREATRWVRFTADSRAGLLVTGAEKGTMRFWRP